MILNPATPHNAIGGAHAPVLSMEDYPTPGTLVPTLSNNPVPLT